MSGPSIDRVEWYALYPDGELDLGMGERLRFTTDGQDHILGAIHDHPRRKALGAHPEFAEGSLCSGGIWFDVPEVAGYEASNKRSYPRWQVVQRNPLTLTPSIRCNTCGDHGFVTGGRWVPA